MWDLYRDRFGKKTQRSSIEAEAVLRTLLKSWSTRDGVAVDAPNAVSAESLNLGHRGQEGKS